MLSLNWNSFKVRCSELFFLSATNFLRSSINFMDDLDILVLSEGEQVQLVKVPVFQ